MSTTTATIAEFATIAVGIGHQVATVETKGTYPFTQPFSEVVDAVTQWAGNVEPKSEVTVSLPISFEEKVAAWVKVGLALSENWQEGWNEKYPFHMDFTEMLFEIERWVDG